MMTAVRGSAYLRVFQALDTLPDADRARWERSIVQGEHVDPPAPVYRQRRAPGGRLGLLTVDEERTDVRLMDGHWYVCPSRTRIRVLAGLLSLRETVPGEVAEVLVPESEARRAARELARIRRRDPRAVPTMLESAWHVPVRWFVLFEDEERRMVERPDLGYRIYYWTLLDEARRRAQRAARVLDLGGLEAVAGVVRDIDEWLGCFGADSAVELDYGEAALSSGWNDLDDDHSAHELQASLDALEAGDVDRAGELYQTVAGRWAEARIRESLN
jgi:hypothetical protein